MIAKLCHNAGIPGKFSNHSLHSTAATQLFEQNVSEHQISNLMGHHSVAVRNYQQILSDKKVEQSNVLYGKKHKTEPTATVTSLDASFEVGSLTQIIDKKLETSPPEIQGEAVVNYTPANVSLKRPVINIRQSEIVIEPVVNLKKSDLKSNENREIVIPPIKVALTINIT